MKVNRLTQNWGEKADALCCKAEVRLFHPNSKWECFLYAANPQNTDEVKCIVCYNGIHFYDSASLQEITESFLFEGEEIQVDEEFWPVSINQLLRRIR